jgi:hypothetical protein
MVTGDRSAVLLALSVAAALTLTGVAAVAAGSRNASVAMAGSSTATDIRRNVTWYGLPISAPRSLHIESSSVGAPAPDEYQIAYADGNFTLVYQRVAGGPISNQFTLSVRGLLEWNGLLEDGHPEDGAMAYTPLGAGAFGRMPITHMSRMAAGGVHVDTFRIQSNQGELAINLTIADGFNVLSPGQTLTPMEAKLTFEINHTMAHSGSNLGLHISLSTNQRLVLDNRSWDDLNEFSSGDRAVNVTNDAGATSSSTFFAWSNLAYVDNHEESVGASDPIRNETTGEYDLYLSYPQTTLSTTQLHIVHDPAMGVVSAAYASQIHPAPGSPLPFQGDVVVYAASLAGIAALIAGTAILVRRRRQK